MDLQERAMLLATSARLTTASADLERMLTGRQPAVQIKPQVGRLIACKARE